VRRSLPPGTSFVRATCHRRGVDVHPIRGRGTRSLETIFGPVQIVRMGYPRAYAPSLYPGDRRLVVPTGRSFCCELQRRLVKPAAQNRLQETVETIAELDRRLAGKVAV
jgi:hypothetical protein